MDFKNYEIEPSFYDEMFEVDGSARAHCVELHSTLTDLTQLELSTMQERVTRSFYNEGITFIVYGDEAAGERIIPIDCVPRVLANAEWRHIESGLDQRLRALNLFLEDVYNEARIINDGVIPVDVIRGCPQYRIEMRGLSAPYGAWVAVCGTDLVRTNDGFRVLEDNLRVPSGVSYMIATRKSGQGKLAKRLPKVAGAGCRALRQAVAENSTRHRATWRVRPHDSAVDPGVYNSAFYEHMFLASELDAELVEGRDLIVNDGYVYMRTTSGLRRVDVIYRRVDDDFIDPTGLSS